VHESSSIDRSASQSREEEEEPQRGKKKDEPHVDELRSINEEN